MSSPSASPSVAQPLEAVVSAEQGECRLLGPFALLVQAALGGLALLALVYKRWRERPQRPVRIWFFDVSKQVFGSVLVHVANIFMSMLTSGRFSIKLDPAATTTATSRSADAQDPFIPNPCSFYLLNLAIDTTLGIPILIVLLRILTALVSFTPLGEPKESIQSGNYDMPPRIGWWLKQSLIYFVGLFAMKICVLLIFVMMPWISQVGDWALKWTEGNEKVQIAFVMMIFPLIMNALQYYIIDSFIKKKEDGGDAERLPTDDPDEQMALYGDEPRDGSDCHDHENEFTEAVEDDELSLRSKGAAHGSENEYDPSMDSDAQTIFGSGSSQHNSQFESGKMVSPDLYHKE